MFINPISDYSDVFSQNLSQGVIHLVGEITDEMAASVIAQMLELDGRIFAGSGRRSTGTTKNQDMTGTSSKLTRNTDKSAASNKSTTSDKAADLASSEPRIRLYINSPGGTVHAGLAIYDTMRTLQTKVDTICVGMAASMAAVILAGGDRRYILPHAEVMIHQPSGGTSGRASDILVAADHIRQRKQVINQILARRTGKPLEQVATDSERDYWMNPEDALSYGIVDEIIPET